MPSVLKKLAGHTAVYGLSSILGRFLNYLLTPLYTSKLVFQPEQYGIITEMYAYVAFLVVLLTYGMETAFFRYFNKSEDPRGTVFGTAAISLICSSSAFIVLVWAFNSGIAQFLGYPNHEEYILWFGLIVGLDALVAIPLARMRARLQPLRFAFVNFVFIAVNIGLNLFFLAYCLPMHKAGESNFLVAHFYDPDIGVGYVFIANLIASICRFLLVVPEFRMARIRFDFGIWKSMIAYALPLLVAGLAGIINETLDRALLKWLLWDDLGEVGTMTQLGIYGACYKLSIVITLCIQAYRYAAEPFFFDQKSTADAPSTYARMMSAFLGFVLIVFLSVALFIDVFKYFIPNEAYWVGLDIVPVLLMANVFLGVYYNQSVWYKVTDNTRIGSYVAIAGALITVVLNLALIPYLGFRGSAWATLVCYASMVAISGVLGQRHYPVPYPFRKLTAYLASALLLFFANHWLNIGADALSWLIRLASVLVFSVSVAYFEIYPTTRHGNLRPNRQ